MEHSYCDINTDVKALGAFTDEQLQDPDFQARLERQIVIASQRVKTYTRFEWWDDGLESGQLEAIPTVVREATAIIAARAVDRPWDPQSGEAGRLIEEKNDTHTYKLSERQQKDITTGHTDIDLMLKPYRRPRRPTVHLAMPDPTETTDESPVDE